MENSFSTSNNLSPILFWSSTKTFRISFDEAKDFLSSNWEVNPFGFHSLYNIFNDRSRLIGCLLSLEIIAITSITLCIEPPKSK